MSEEYNSPGSPYWAFKAFLPLALADDHPFWAAAEEETPALERPLMIAGASMLVQRERADVIALPAAPVRLDMRNSPDKYGKFAYSSRFGLCVEADRWITSGFIGDNILAVSVDGVDYRSRRAIDRSRLGGHWLETQWSPLSGVMIATLQSFVRGWELRIHDVSTETPLTAVETGHCVPTRIGTRGRLSAQLQAPTGAARGLMIALDDGQGSAIIDLSGHRTAGAADAAPNTNILFPHAAAPFVVGAFAIGRGLLISAVRASATLSETWGEIPTLKNAAALAADAGWDSARVEAGARSVKGDELLIVRYAAVT